MSAGVREGRAAVMMKGAEMASPRKEMSAYGFLCINGDLELRGFHGAPRPPWTPRPLHCSRPQQPQRALPPWHQPASPRARKAPPGSALTGLFRTHHSPKTHRPCEVLLSSPPLAAQSTRQLWPQLLPLMLRMCPNRSPTLSIHRTYCGLSAPHLLEQE